MSSAAIYIRTDEAGRLPEAEEQRERLRALAEERGHEVVAEYSDLAAPGYMLYHRDGLKAAIENIKESEDWEVLLTVEPECISETETSVHEFVHKFSLYNNRLESPRRSWVEYLAAMQDYRREMAR